MRNSSGFLILFYVYQIKNKKFIFKDKDNTMIYIDKGTSNNLILNINNNSQVTYTTYILQFTHILSQEFKSYTIHLNDPTEYVDNDRYCDIVLPLNSNNLNYLGQYELRVLGDGTDLLLTSMVTLEGQIPASEEFVEYVSPNESNENYIYTN